MITTITKFAVSAAGLATWLNPGRPTAALYIVDTVSKRGAKIPATATSYQFPTGQFGAGDEVDLVRAGGSVFSATIPTAPVAKPVNLSLPVITEVS